MLRLSNLTAGYDTVPVIFNISLEVAESELVAIVGSNGAGKSTILKTISGLLKPFSGEIEFLGKKDPQIDSPRNSKAWNCSCSGRQAYFRKNDCQR